MQEQIRREAEGVRDVGVFELDRAGGGRSLTHPVPVIDDVDAGGVNIDHKYTRVRLGLVGDGEPIDQLAAERTGAVCLGAVDSPPIPGLLERDAELEYRVRGDLGVRVREHLVLLGQARVQKLLGLVGRDLVEQLDP